MAPLPIPTGISQCLLSNEKIMIADFLQFKLPPVALMTKAIDTHLYFSTNSPFADTNKIHLIPTPPVAVVKALVVSLFPDTVCSIGCPHIPAQASKQYPVWVVTYWNKVILLHNTHRRWAWAQTFLQTWNTSWRWQCDGEPAHMDESTQLLDEVNNIFNVLPWGGTIQGFEVAIPMVNLAWYATQDWLTGKHEDQMLDLLRQELMDNGMLLSIDIESIQFSTKLRYAYTCCNVYSNSDKSFAWVHGQGEWFVGGTRNQLGMIVNIDGNHWVAVILNFCKGIIWFGDSLGNTIPPDLLAILKWWTHTHTGKCFDVVDLPITRQTNGYSCGLLAWNALVVFFLQGKYNLIHGNEVDDKRLRVLLRVFSRHQDKVCHSHTSHTT
jgi:hypothetical protein